MTPFETAVLERLSSVVVVLWAGFTFYVITWIFTPRRKL